MFSFESDVVYRIDGLVVVGLLMAVDVEEMDDPHITMEEYIQLEAEKARRHSQEFSWEIARCGNVWYFEDIDYFKDFENEFLAIVYKDVLTFDPEDSSELTICAHHV
uniref:Uncharacterized protein n=1 Tax=Tanacetum cinerariifolium TaxID=118510 RepID=A0A699GQK8_TANCI|nr:hypothetical protein [Tanacetum cinerariifolium]